MKKVVCVLLTVCLLASMASVGLSAKAASEDLLPLATARNIATYFLASNGIVSERMPNAHDGVFRIIDTVPLLNIHGETECYDFAFADDRGDARGYIIVSRDTALPLVTQWGFGESPYAIRDNENIYYINPLVWYRKHADGSYTDRTGKPCAQEAVKESFEHYKDTGTSSGADSKAAAEVAAQNTALLSAIDDIKATAVPDIKDFKGLLAYITDLLQYYVGWVWHGGDIAQTNAYVENLIRDHAGDGYEVSESVVTDKTYMLPKRQSDYHNYLESGICGKASSMMTLSFYRDAMGFDALPDDVTMYAEFSALYADINERFAFFFENPFINDELGLSQSYEMLGTLDMGLAYYLYQKGYIAAAQNVIDNAGFSVTMVPDAFTRALMQVIRRAMSAWIEEKTDGALSFLSAQPLRPREVIVRTLKAGEPVVIGCLTALGDDTFSNHYFAGVGYYRLEYTGGGRAAAKEYIEVYDTWGRHSSVMDWTIFKNTALYSSTSLADV